MVDVEEEAKNAVVFAKKIKRNFFGWKQFRRGIPIPKSEDDFLDSGLKTLE